MNTLEMRISLVKIINIIARYCIEPPCTMYNNIWDKEIIIEQWLWMSCKWSQHKTEQLNWRERERERERECSCMVIGNEITHKHTHAWVDRMSCNTPLWKTSRENIIVVWLVPKRKKISHKCNTIHARQCTQIQNTHIYQYTHGLGRERCRVGTHREGL